MGMSLQKLVQDKAKLSTASGGDVIPEVDSNAGKVIIRIPSADEVPVSVYKMVNNILNQTK